MKRMVVWLLVAVFSLTACTTLAKRQRINKFEEMERQYRQALMASEFAQAARYIDPAVPLKPLDPKVVRLLKIVDYKPTYVNVSEDMLEVEQQVTLKFFTLDTNRLRTIDYRQVWRFNETHKIWLLQNDLPEFIP